MADLSVTAANVQSVPGATIKTGSAGASITAGEPVFIDSTDSLTKPAANTGDAASRVEGIALHAAETGQPIKYIAAGDIDMGAVLTVGELYILAGAGAVSPAGDAITGDWITYLGIATAADNLKLNIQASGVQLA